jgi:hypothetical protein
MTHANCGCCCDNSYPLIGPTGPTGNFYDWLNATGRLDAGPLAPQEYRGQGFQRHIVSTNVSLSTGVQAVAAQHLARGGSVEFPDFQGSVVNAITATRAPGSGSFPDSWFASNLPKTGICEVTVEWGQHIARNGGPLVTGPSPNFSTVAVKTLLLDGTAVPLHGMGMPNAEGLSSVPAMGVYRTRLTDELDLTTVTDGSPPTGNLSTITSPQSRDASSTVRYYRTPTGMIVETKSIKPTLEGRIVVERDGVVVADRIRPTGPVYDADTAADGSYIVSKYFGREHDDPNKIHLWPPRPERLVLSFAKDATVPKYGLLAINDRYADESVTSTTVFATKPYLRSGSFQLPSHADESVPGAAVRPSRTQGFGNSAFQIRYLPSQTNHTTVTLGGSPATGVLGQPSEYRDVFQVNPTSLPVVPCRVFPVPSGGKGPRPVLEHPGKSTREPYRPLTQAERVEQVALSFSEEILPTGVVADQVRLAVDGVETPGCTLTPLAESPGRYAIGVPTGPQAEGAFVVLTYDPAGQVFSATGNRPSELAARTSWMMQKPYKQDRNVGVGERVIDIGQLATLSATGPIGPAAESLTISLSNEAHINKTDFGTVAHRPNQDLFAPQMPYDATGPSPTTGPTDCSYYGMTTAIWPCGPTGLSCPMPRLPQPHNSAFRHDRGAGNITVTLSGTNVEESNGTFFGGQKLADSLENYGPLEFTPTRNGLQMPQGTWSVSKSSEARLLLGTVVNFFPPPEFDGEYEQRLFFENGTIEGTLTARRPVTEYPALGWAFAWSLVFNMELRIVNNYTVEFVPLDGGPTPPPQTFTRTIGKSGTDDRGFLYFDNTFQAAVTAAEELAGTLVRQPNEYGFDARYGTTFPPLTPFLVPRSSRTFAWPAPGLPVPSWPFGTVQVDF